MRLSVWGGIALSLLLTLTCVQPVHTQSSVTGPLNNATSFPVGSCMLTTCANGACCNSYDSSCGFGPPYCTPVSSGGNCTSNCEAQAECGQYAQPADSACPLNACCSQDGFCGTTSEFCGTGCQSNCGDPVVPVCGAETNSALTRRIGYYNGTAASRSCMAFSPEHIYTEDITHVNFAFAHISDSFQLVEANSGDSQLWQRTTNLKNQDPTLKVFLSIGGWSFNDPPTSTIFSRLVASTDNTNTFIASVLSIMETYAFDGIDIDWEYPGASDRGGGPADTENFVTFMAAVKAAFSTAGYGLSFTAPSSYWYLRHFDLPGLLKSADWVNVMTYDLHGVWDGANPYIGDLVVGHTDLIENEATFDLYWRAGVNPSQVTMGFAFYARSFMPAGGPCEGPGCTWVSPGTPGRCSSTSGVLMWSEMDEILAGSGDFKPLFDPVAAVKFVEWEGDSISYDDAQTFGMKLNYANDHCLGGSMIWSLDQDDSKYSALSALYGNVTEGIASGVSQGARCLETDWGASGCPIGYSSVGSDQNRDGQSRYICCVSTYVPSPDSCAWMPEPTGTSPYPPTCPQNYILLATSTDTRVAAFCCKTSVAISCELGDTCESNPTCPADNSTLVTTLVSGYSAKFSCTDGKSKPFCCVPSEFPYANCSWVGTPPLCLDSGCAVGQVTVISDVQGDASQSCSGDGTRTYCCDPIGNDPVPVPFDDIFPSGAVNGTVTSDVQFDPDVGTTDSSVSSSSNSTTNNDENTEAFGEVFIDSPNAQSVSSLSKASDWVVTSCDAKSDQPQTVLAYCSKSMDSSGCAHVFIGGTEHTIVQMPSSCGLGRYARVVSLTPHTNQSILSASHQAKKPATEPVYSLSFDYEFSVIPASNGPIYMRADVTDMPGYWDSVVESPPERKRWLREQEMKKPIHRRWWGSFTAWLTKVTTVKKNNKATRTFQWRGTWIIYEDGISCAGPEGTEFEASMDITLTGVARASASFGYYLEATIVPPAVQAVYLFLSTDAYASAAFVIQGSAIAQYDSDNIKFATFAFPGFYVPGLLTIGPSLVINGYISGELSMGGSLELSAEVQFPPVNIQLGYVNDSFVGTSTPYDSLVPAAPNTTFDVGVELAGDMSLHFVPAIQIGINVLNGELLDAQAYVQTDLYTGISVNASASPSQAIACFNGYCGVDFYGGLTGSVLYWEGATIQWPFYQTEYNFMEGCTPDHSGSVKRSMPDLHLHEPKHEPVVQQAPDARYSAYILEEVGDQERYIYPVNQLLTIDPPTPAPREHLIKRGTDNTVPLVPGILECPGSSGLDGTDGDVYSDLPTDSLDAMAKRSLERIPPDEDEDDFDLLDFLFAGDDEDDAIFRRTVIDPVSAPLLTHSVKVPRCPGKEFSPLPSNEAASFIYWDLRRPEILDPEFWPRGQKMPNHDLPLNTHGREHIYEVHLISQFIASLSSHQQFWPSDAPFCDWVDTIIQGPILQGLLSCLPNDGKPDYLGGVYMPWLESRANEAKASAFTPALSFSERTFSSYTPTKQVSIMRSIAGATAYMNDPLIEESFLIQSRNEYNSDITPIYNAWITDKVNTFNVYIQDQMNGMISWWIRRRGKTAMVRVALGFGYVVSDLKTYNPPFTEVSGQDLQDKLGNYVLQHPINWANELNN